VSKFTGMMEHLSSALTTVVREEDVLVHYFRRAKASQTPNCYHESVRELRNSRWLPE